MIKTYTWVENTYQLIDGDLNSKLGLVTVKITYEYLIIHLGLTGIYSDSTLSAVGDTLIEHSFAKLLITSGVHETVV